MHRSDIQHVHKNGRWTQITAGNWVRRSGRLERMLTTVSHNAVCLLIRAAVAVFRCCNAEETLVSGQCGGVLRGLMVGPLQHSAAATVPRPAAAHRRRRRRRSKVGVHFEIRQTSLYTTTHHTSTIQRPVSTYYAAIHRAAQPSGAENLHTGYSCSAERSY